MDKDPNSIPGASTLNPASRLGFSLRCTEGGGILTRAAASEAAGRPGATRPCACASLNVEDWPSDPSSFEGAGHED